MNKMIMAALLVGISGTSLVAAPTTLNLGALPADLQAKIKSAQEKATATPNPLEQYISATKAKIVALQAEIKKRIDDNPYLNNNDSAKTDEEILTTSLANLNSVLSALEDSSQKIQYNMSVADTVSEALAEQTFPYACGTFTGGTLKKGYVLRKLFSRDFALYPTENNEDKNFTDLFKINGGYEVGTIGKADWSPMVISGVNSTKRYSARVININGKDTVVCLGD